MSILDFNATTPSNRNARNASQPSDRPEAKVWLNVGYEVTTKNEDGEDVVTFVNLPVGIPLDTMEPLKISGQNESFIQLRSAQNALLKALQEAGDSLDPGEKRSLTLVVEMRKRAEPTAVRAEDNPFSINPAALLA